MNKWSLLITMSMTNFMLTYFSTALFIDRCALIWVSFFNPIKSWNDGEFLEARFKIEFTLWWFGNVQLLILVPSYKCFYITIYNYSSVDKLLEMNVISLKFSYVWLEKIKIKEKFPKRGEPLKLRIKLPEDGKIKSTYPSFRPIYTPDVDNISGTISSVIGSYFSHSFIGDYLSSRLVHRILLCPNRTKSVPVCAVWKIFNPGNIFHQV